MAKTTVGNIVKCDHGREGTLRDQERLDEEKARFGREEQGTPGRHACTVCAWRMGYEAALADVAHLVGKLGKPRA